jgi:hypothetical protein
MQLSVQQCSFVPASAVFAGSSRAWDTFIESDPPYTWGSNNRTLVAADALAAYLQDTLGPDNEDLPATLEALQRVVDSLRQLPAGVYVDLEN